MTEQLIAECDQIFSKLNALPINQKIDAINAIKLKLKEYSPHNREPVDCVIWVNADDLHANDYNPNFVLTPEMKLLKTSLLTNGWIQPLLISKEGVIIDGFHRHLQAKHDKDVRVMTEGKVPCAVLDISRPEAIMLTVRINRAKGTHSAVQMHKLVTDLVNVHQLTIKEVMKGWELRRMR